MFKDPGGIDFEDFDFWKDFELSALSFDNME